jgi:hypothetical protein
MIDYFAHVSALRVCMAALAVAPPADPAHNAAVKNGLKAAKAEPGSAMLGAMVDHLLQYSQAQTSKELDLLRKASILFLSGLKVLKQFKDVLPDLEGGLTTPLAPKALDKYNAALSKVPVIHTDVKNLHADVKDFQKAFLSNWMAPVGQQQDAPVNKWLWRDVFLTRRTTAFVAAAQALATTARQKAFAVGVFAGAAGNVFGSGYLNAVVGGPRRSHQLRHRLAAYSVGAWLRDNQPAIADSLASIRAALSFGETGTLTLPSDIETLANDALHIAYPSGTAAFPDLSVGYRNLMEHLSLLDQFTLPPVPAPLNTTLTGELMTDGATLGADNIHPTGSGIGTNYPGIGPHEDAGAVCGTLLAWLFWPPSAIVAFDNSLGGNSVDPSIGVSQDGLQAASASSEARKALNSLSGSALSSWQALSAARSALVLRGLLYPNPDDLTNPTFAQFLSIPTTSHAYPAIPSPAPHNGTTWPTSALEQPATSPAPYSVLGSPLTFLTGATESVSSASSTLWIDMIAKHREGQGSIGNLNLDSDRGFGAPCWALAPGSLITDEPVNVVTLDYKSI